MSKWEMVKLGEVCSVQAGGTPSRNKLEFWENGTIPWVKIGDLNGKYLNVTEEHITQAGLNNSSTKLFEKNTILYTIFATLGEVSILNISACTNQAIAGLNIVSNNIEVNFLYFFLLSIKKKVVETGRGVAQNNINLTILRNIEIPLPPLETQKKIADELDKITALIEKRKSQIEKLDLLTKAKFVEMFGDPMLNPMGWEEKKWQDVLGIKNGRNQKKVECSNGNYPIYGSGGIMAYANDYICNENSVIIGRKGNINKPILVKQKYWNVDTAFGLEPKIELLICEYLFYFCIWFDFEQLNKTVTIPSLTKSDLYAVKMPVPPLDLQNKFAQYVEQIENTRYNMEKGLTQLETLYKQRMQNYFG